MKIETKMQLIYNCTECKWCWMDEAFQSGECTHSVFCGHNTALIPEEGFRIDCPLEDCETELKRGER